MIEYKPRGDSVINVRLDSRLTGTIRRTVGERGGWRYHPLGSSKNAGELFPTLDACKRSLEG